MEVTGILENIIQQYQHEIFVLKKDLDEIKNAASKIRAMYELSHPNTAAEAEKLQRLEKVIEQYYNQERQFLIKQNKLLQKTNEELEKHLLNR